MVKTKGTGTFNAATGAYFKDGGFYTAKELKEVPDNWAEYGGMMKEGGIHINPANKGKFNATKKATGKSTEELTHSTNPVTKKRAIFAQNAAKWHHEYGGLANGDNGAIYDSGGNVFAMGGRVNPFHPLAQFMQAGGTTNGAADDYSGASFGMKKADTKAGITTNNGPGSESPDDAFADTGIAPATPKAPPLNADGTVKQDSGPVNIPNDPDRGSDTWRQGMTDQEANEELQQHTTPPGTYTPPVVNNNGVRKQGYNDLLGAGLAVASGFQAMKNNRWQMPGQDRTLIVNAQGHGRQDQFGNMSPGSTYAQQAIGKFGGKKFQEGGDTGDGGQQMSYKKGQVIDVDEATINSLIRQGYKLQKA